jgi:hydroxymethylbilane synthase
VIGTSSLRRAAQLLNHREDLKIVSIRGNVDTRLRKLTEGDLDAVILAGAGLRRLHLEERITEQIPVDVILPAVGQGALGLELREGDERTLDLVAFLNHDPTETAVRAERAFLREMEGGCQVPIAGYCRWEGSRFTMEGRVAELDGSLLLKEKQSGDPDRPEAVGVSVAQNLIAAGADKILEKIYRNSEG